MHLRHSENWEKRSFSVEAQQNCRFPLPPLRYSTGLGHVGPDDCNRQDVTGKSDQRSAYIPVQYCYLRIHQWLEGERPSRWLPNPKPMLVLWLSRWSPPTWRRSGMFVMVKTICSSSCNYIRAPAKACSAALICGLVRHCRVNSGWGRIVDFMRDHLSPPLLIAN